MDPSRGEAPDIVDFCQDRRMRHRIRRQHGPSVAQICTFGTGGEAR